MVSQVPFPGVQFGRASERSAKVTLQLLAAGVSEVVRGWLRRSPRLVPVFGDPGDMAAFTSPHNKAIIDELATSAPEWRNAVAARMLRHPAYTAVALILTGIALACDDIWSLIAATALGGTGLAVRIRAEERQLTNALGGDYEHYAASRKRLVPGVW